MIHFTKEVNPAIASKAMTYSMTTYTHNYSAGYGSPEVDHTTPEIIKATVSDDNLSVSLKINEIQEGHIHDFDLAKIKSRSDQSLLHSKAYYTVNEIPKK
jgi:hypothetical protein